MTIVEARSQIQELTARYALYVDTFQLEPLVGLFLEDGVLDEVACGLARHEGRTALTAYYRELFDMIDGTVHLTGNHILDQFDGATARGSCSSIIVGAINGSPVQLICRYDDVYVRTQDGWRFRSRVVLPYLPVDPGIFGH
jgi:SnoaL-like domain